VRRLERIEPACRRSEMSQSRSWHAGSLAVPDLDKTRRGTFRHPSPAPCPQIEEWGQPAEHQGPSGSAVATRALDTPQNAPTGSAMGSAAPCGSLHDLDPLRTPQRLQCGAGPWGDASHSVGPCAAPLSPHPPLGPPGHPRSGSPSLDPIEQPTAVPDADDPQPFAALDSASTRSHPCCHPAHPSSWQADCQHAELSAAGTPRLELDRLPRLSR
jgi:hypothetical protein